MTAMQAEKPVGDASPSAGFLARYRDRGHATAERIFADARIGQALDDLSAWSEEVLSGLTAAEERWYLDQATGKRVLRKLDNPHSVRPFFKTLAHDPALVAHVEALIGRGVSVYFSQIFFKPPHGGGPKPAHQDNFYFGPSDPEGVVTAWIALDDADEENGCLRFGQATHKGPILPHSAPDDRPFDLQIAEADLAAVEMRPAPVPRGGVSFHHGGTVHRSGDNRSDRWRRACALHYVRNDVVFATPALPYDSSLVLRIT